MKKLNFRNIPVTGLILVFSGICSSGYSQKKSDQNLQKDGLKIEYNYPAGKTVRYVNETKIVQNMDVMGQSMMVNITMYMGCEIKGKGKDSGNLKLEIKIDSLAQNVESPQGSGGGSINDLKGKLFNMLISPSGKILDMSEATKIVYTLEGSGVRTLDQEFFNYFPSLPLNAVKPGDTWVTHDTLNTKTTTSADYNLVESDFKFEGIEIVDGIDCAKITVVQSGTRKITTQSQGMEIHIAGPFTGTQTLLFAVKEGYLVKESVASRLTGKIEIPDQNMTFAVVMDYTSTNTAVK